MPVVDNMQTAETLNDRASILVVEDEVDLARMLQFNLERDGYGCTVANSGDKALQHIKENPPNLVLLDRMLPGLTGDDVIMALRREPKTAHIPVIMLTAKAEEDDQLVGFAFGADDYVTKPFSMKVLLARVAAVVRRPKKPSEEDTVIKAGPVVLNVTRYEVAIRGQSISPTATEFRILAALLRGKGRVFSRSQLLNQAFGENVIVTDRTIDVHVTALRKKLGNAANWLQTVRGVGYTFREPSSD
ncbi:MAG: DNA-binding response regulator [Phycisphaerae bacterium]|nr:MAG: DNA-binding response regulator [Phycisphaerae bacterium]